MSWLDKIKVEKDRTDFQAADPSKIRRRLKMVATHELVTIVETTVSEVGRNVYDAQHAGDEAQAVGYLTEAEMGAESLIEMVRELRARRAVG